jgi:hypothetical protein
VSHLIPDGGMSDLLRCIEVVDAAADNGADVAFDMHTRLFGVGYLSAAVPPALLQAHRPRWPRDSRTGRRARASGASAAV